jgi:hypothetical protein
MRMRRRVGSVVLSAVVAVGAAVVLAGGSASPAAADGGAILYGWGNNVNGQTGTGTAGAGRVRPMRRSRCRAMPCRRPAGTASTWRCVPTARCDLG